MKQESTFPQAVKNLTEQSASQSWALAAGDASWALHQAYHELDTIPVRKVDLIESVEENVQRLEELQSRLRFMMKEVKYLLKL